MTTFQVSGEINFFAGTYAILTGLTHIRTCIYTYTHTHAHTYTHRYYESDVDRMNSTDTTWVAVVIPALLYTCTPTRH